MPNEARQEESDGPRPAQTLPIVWLLGKTGAGKSSLLRALTGLDDVEIGNGFQSCTQTSRFLDVPAEAPVLRFLDTRGFGEVTYDPAADLAEIKGHAHVALVVAKLTDPVQEEVAQALRTVRKARPALPTILVLTGADLVSGEAANRVAAGIRARMSKAAGGPLPEVRLSLAPGGEDAAGLDALLDQLADILPSVALLLSREQAQDEESQQFHAHRTRVLRFASSAAGADFLPVVGAVGAPAVQAAMLDWLARQYGLTWSRHLLRDLLGLLGAGIALRFGASYGLRQLAKLVPVAGQTAGAAASGAIAFATTYALGRAGAYYLYHKSAGRAVDRDALRRLYADTLRGARGGSSR